MRKHGIAVSCHAPYYINLCNPDDNEIIKSIGYIKRSIHSVKLMGGGNLEFAQSFGALAVKLPEKLPTKYVNCLEIRF